MRTIRVLIVDDSIVVRRMVSDVLAEDAALEVVGTAANGKLGVEKIAQVKPDVVTLDIEMPEMNGLEALAEIRKLHPSLPVIMFSTLTERGAAVTLDALTHGASDYVTKPTNVCSITEAKMALRDELIPKIKALATRALQMGNRASAQTNTPVRAIARKSQRIGVVAIGISTGGPNALAGLLPVIPADFPVPLLIVQHMPPMFTEHLADRLNHQSQIEVHEAVNGEIAQPGHAYIAPGEFHMIVERNHRGIQLSTHRGPPENSCRPAVDTLFRSAVAVYGAATLGVVMTGMGQDGLRGCEQIRAVGGSIFAQDEETSVVWGMPGCVAKAGLADTVLPLAQIAESIIARVTNVDRYGIKAQTFSSST